MQMAALVVALAAVGIDYGWQPVAGGGIEYIIQIPPEAVDGLLSGQDIFSDLPPQLRGIRSYRITVGNGELPHAGDPPPDMVLPAAGMSTLTNDLKGRTTAQNASSTITRPTLPATRTNDWSDFSTAQTAALPPKTFHPMSNTEALRDSAFFGATSSGFQTTGYGQTAATQPATTPATTAAAVQPATASTSAAAKEEDKPWGLFTGALLVLFLSIGANVYLGWITLDLRHRCRTQLSNRALRLET